MHTLGKILHAKLDSSGKFAQGYNNNNKNNKDIIINRYFQLKPLAIRIKQIIKTIVAIMSITIKNNVIRKI